MLLEQIRRINLRLVFLLFICILLSAGLGFSLNNLFSLGFAFELSARLLIPLIFLVFLTAFLTVFSLVASEFWRWSGYFLSALGFSLPLLLFPSATSNQDLSLFLAPVIYLLGLLFFDRSVHWSVKNFAIFSARIFSGAYSKVFLSIIVVIGILVFSATPTEVNVKTLLGPFLDPLVGTVFEQLGIPAGEEEKELVAGQTIAEVERFLGPFLEFLPLIFAATAALSLLVLSPVVNILTIFAFAAIYRLLVLAGIVRFVEEERKVPVLKLA